MKVHELIAALQGCDRDWDVLMAGEEGQQAALGHVAVTGTAVLIVRAPPDHGALDASGLTMPIYFRNHQWAVTGYGMECVGGIEWRIRTVRLAECVEDDDQNAELYDWPLVAAEKNWVDLAAFLEAFRKAWEFHASLPPLDAAKLEATIATATRDGRAMGR